MPIEFDDDDDFNTDLPHHLKQYGKSARPSIMRAPNQMVDNPMWNGRPIRHMESDHIMNAILYCEKRFTEARANWIQCHAFEQGPVDQINTAKSNFYFKSVYDMFPDYKYLRAEWERRADL